MHENYIIKLENISKSYKLYPNPTQFGLDVLGVNKLFFWKKKQFPLFEALADINLNIKQGERIGIIGRNGAGKTTLLKILTKNFAPTSGSVKVVGKIQSLMDAGLGFHPEFTGMENIKASLLYNGLNKKEVTSAIEDIVDFAELGDFLEQPIKTYSLGMQSRLAFAAATAIRPDILIVDEVLGAGDAYFSLKSAERMKRLTKKGTTLLLVSHSNSQILQFCEKCVWLDKGRIHQQGSALEVVKSYDKHIQELENTRLNQKNKKKSLALENVPTEKNTQKEKEDKNLSRWEGLGGLKIKSVKILDKDNIENGVFYTNDTISFDISITATEKGTYKCQAIIVIFTLDGTLININRSKEEKISLDLSDTANFKLTYEDLKLGSGNYMVSVSIHKFYDLNTSATQQAYDLIDRSFEFKVINRDSTDQSLITHESKWESHSPITI